MTANQEKRVKKKKKTSFSDILFGSIRKKLYLCSGFKKNQPKTTFILTNFKKLQL